MKQRKQRKKKHPKLRAYGQNVSFYLPLRNAIRELATARFGGNFSLANTFLVEKGLAALAALAAETQTTPNIETETPKKRDALPF